MELRQHKRRSASPILACAVLLIPFNCPQTGSSGHVTASVPATSGNFELQGGRAMSFTLKSTAFANDGEIPRKFTCNGADLSPALNWIEVPKGTQSLALIADDPDAPAGTWTHWTIWNISAKATALPEGLPQAEMLDNGARQGRNDFRRIGYNGPCPPSGRAHRYFFRLYALDARLDLKAGAARDELELAMKRHVLSQTELMGTYRR
jgi:Raf kinase inhibitor-like YbhB/YbcL family protein